MHGVKRSAVYLELAEKLREALLPRLASLSQQALALLLQKTFPYVSIEELSSVPMAVMMRMDAVDPVFLAELGKHADLYEKAPMKIKRQIWAVNYELFRAHVYPVLEPFLGQAAAAEAPVNEIWNRALEEPRQRRRNCQAITAMLTCLDKSQSLYKSLLDLCWRLFREDGNPLFCTLRADVLMGLHDNSVTELYQHDPYHELCWILDAATRERSMSDALARDLATAQSKLTVLRAKEKAEQAMLFANPHVLHALLRSACVALMRAVQDRALPSDSKRCPTLKLLVKLLVLAKVVSFLWGFLLFPHRKKKKRVPVIWSRSVLLSLRRRLRGARFCLFCVRGLPRPWCLGCSRSGAARPCLRLRRLVRSRLCWQDCWPVTGRRASCCRRLRRCEWTRVSREDWLPCSARLLPAWRRPILILYRRW